MTRRHLLSLLAVAFLVPAAGLAQKANPIHVDQPWARASAGMTGAVYLTVKNDGDTADKLLAVRTPVAGSAELHTTTMDGNVMKMRPVLDIPVAAHGTAELKPGGMHVMLMDLRAPLKQGDKFPLTLKFEKAGDISVEVAVEVAGAMGPATMNMDHMQR